MQMMAMMFAGQEQQRVTNEWVVRSVEAISTSSGCAIEAPPASQDLVELPPALVRMTQTEAQGTAIVDPKSTETGRGRARSGRPSGDYGHGLRWRRIAGAPQTRLGRGAPTGTPAASAKAVSPPARTAKQLPSNTGMPPAPEAMDGRDDDYELFFEQVTRVEDDEVAARPARTALPR